MNLTVIAGLTIIVLVEKLTPIGAAAARVLGVAMLAGGAWFLAR